MYAYITTLLALTGTSIRLIHGEIPLEVKAHMDSSIHPCTDFYKYACGGWMNTNQLSSSDKRLEASFDMIETHNAHVFEKILDEKHPIIDEFWESCMNADVNHGHKTLQVDLSRVMNAPTRVDLLVLAGEFARTGGGSFIKVSVKPDVADATVNTMYVSAADLTLQSPAAYIGDTFKKISKEYRVYINELMKLSGFIFPKEMRHISAADAVIGLEEKLAMLKMRMKEDIYNMPIASLVTYLPMTFPAFVKGMELRHKTKITKHQKIYINDLEYLIYIENWLESFPEDYIKVYIAFRMVHSRVHWLGHEYSSLWFKFFGHTLNGKQHAPSRYSLCKEHVSTYLSNLIGKHYYSKAFDPERQVHALSMMKLMKQGMKQRISRTNWFTEKDHAITKLTQMIPLIGQTSELKTYPFELSRHDYPSNMYRLVSHAFDHELKKIGQRVDRKESNESPLNANAKYISTKNSIVITAGVLQSPLFHGPQAHPARNFGAIGSIMGHELTHGYDRLGREFDEHGNLKTRWTDSMINVFDDHAKCFQDQFSAFEVDGETGIIGKINGNMTLNENIADTEGLSLAWDAYRIYVTNMESFKEDVKGEGDQLFFISYAQTHCMKNRDDMMQQLLVSDSYSPGQWRVNGAIMNNPRFASVFQCKVGTPMNPRQKCGIWTNQ